MATKTTTKINVNSLTMDEIHDLQKQITAKITEDNLLKKATEQELVKKAMQDISDIQDEIQLLVNKAVDIVNNSPKDSYVTFYMPSCASSIQYERVSGWINSEY